MSQQDPTFVQPSAPEETAWLGGKRPQATVETEPEWVKAARDRQKNGTDLPTADPAPTTKPVWAKKDKMTPKLVEEHTLPPGIVHGINHKKFAAQAEGKKNQTFKMSDPLTGQEVVFTTEQIAAAPDHANIKDHIEPIFAKTETTPAQPLPASTDHPAIQGAVSWLVSQEDLNIGTLIIREVLLPLGFEDPEAAVGDRAEFGRRVKNKVLSDKGTRLNARLEGFARWQITKSRACQSEPWLLGVVVCKIVGLEVLLDLAMREVARAGR